MNVESAAEYGSDYLVLRTGTMLDNNPRGHKLLKQSEVRRRALISSRERSQVREWGGVVYFGGLRLTRVSVNVASSCYRDGYFAMAENMLLL